LNINRDLSVVSLPILHAIIVKNKIDFFRDRYINTHNLTKLMRKHLLKRQSC